MVTSMADMFVGDDALFDHLLYPLAETVTFLNSSLNQLVEQRTGNAEVMGSNPVEALIFFFFFQASSFQLL